MYKNDINRINEYYNSQLNKLGQFVAFEELSQIDLHPAILRYISAEIDYLIFEDREKLLHNSSFDYSSDKIKYYFSLIAAEIRKQRRFSIEYIAKLILHAVSFNIHHLVKPNWALKKFVFENQEKKSQKEIEQILLYVYHYPYTQRVISSYFKKKNISVVALSLFNELLERIDKISVSEYKPNLIETAIRSISEFFNIGKSNNEGVPVAALRTYFEEKNMLDEITVLDESFQNDEFADEIALLRTFGIEVELFDDADLPSEETRKFIQDQEEAIRQSMEEITGKSSESGIAESVNEPEVSKFIQEKIQYEIEETFAEVDGISIVEEASKENSDVAELNGLASEGVSNTSEETGNDIENEELENEAFTSEDDSTVVQNDVNESDEEEELLEDEFEEIIIDEKEEFEFVEESLNDESVDNNDDTTHEEIVEKITDESFEESLFADAGEEESDDTDIEGSTESVKTDEEEFVDEKFINKFESTDEKERSSIDVSKLIENKNMSKIIESIFDYDMQEFTGVIEEFTECSNLEEALNKLNDIFDKYHIEPDSKEGQTFKSIIEENFQDKR